MTFYEYPRFQESREWTERLRQLPREELIDELIGRAYEIVSVWDEGRRETMERHLSFLFDPEEGKQYALQREAQDTVDEIETWLKAGAPDLGDLSEEEIPADDTEEMPRYQQELARRRALSRLSLLEKAMATMEFGLAAGETPDGGAWTPQETHQGALEIVDLQKELGMPVMAGRLREAIRRGLGERYDTVAIPILIQLAQEADDPQAFNQAGERFTRLTSHDKDVSGLPGRILGAAPQFVGSLFNRRPLHIALDALGHMDPSTINYPSHCVRLALGLQGLQEPEK